MTRGRPKYDDILTPREWDVLALLREGLTNQQIADRLGVSLNTSKYHVSEIFTKLGVTNREAAVSWRPEGRRLALLAPIAMWVQHLATSTTAKVALGAAAVGVVGVLVVALAIVRQDDGDAGPLGTLAYIQAGDVWVKAVPDGTPRRLTTEGNASFPRWSTSGDWLLFRVQPESAGTEEWLMRSDGSELRRLDAAEYAFASWSPLADELLYVRPNGETIIEPADASAPRVVLTPYSSPTELGSIYGSWSPDGTYVWYLEERWLDTDSPRGTDEAPRQPSDAQVTHIAAGRVRFDGSGKQDTVTLAPDSGQRIVPLNWSGDGQTLLFATIPREGGEFIQDGFPVRAVAAAGGPVRDLGVTVTLSSLASSPGSSRVMLVVGDQRETWTNKQIVAVDIGSDAMTRLTPADHASIAPMFSRDGERIAYVGAPDLGAQGRAAAFASRRIWVMDADGSGRHPVTSGEGFRDEAPQWSTDGSHILFMRMTLDRCAPTYAIELLDLGTGTVEEVASGFPVASMNDRPIVGAVPECASTSSDAGILDMYGRVQFSEALAWWQDESRTVRED